MWQNEFLNFVHTFLKTNTRYVHIIYFTHAHMTFIDFRYCFGNDREVTNSFLQTKLFLKKGKSTSK